MGCDMSDDLNPAKGIFRAVLAGVCAYVILGVVLLWWLA